MPKRIEFTPEQLERIRLLYPTTSDKQLADEMGCSTKPIRRVAKEMGITKCPEYMDSVNSGIKKMIKLSKQGRLGCGTPRGTKPFNTHPIGAEIEKKRSGLVYRKVSDTGSRTVDWRPVSHLVWEEVNGKVPKGCMISFKDGNVKNVDIDNLELLTRQEMVSRNSSSRYPEEVRKLIAVKREFTRRMNKVKRGEK